MAQDTIDLFGHCGLGHKAETKHNEVYKNKIFVFRNEQVKANEHLLMGAYIDVRDQNKAKFNAEMRSL